jgi:hypothetical protein
VTELVIAALTTACCVFLASAAAKLRGRPAYRSFVAGLAETKLIPQRLLSAAAAALVSCEALVALGAVTAAVLTAANMAGAAAIAVCALGLAVVLTAVLASGIAIILHRGTRARCACFGATSDQVLGRPHLARNIGLLVLLAAAVICTQGSHGHPTAGGIAIAASAGGLIGLLLIRFDDLIVLFVPVDGRSAG